MFYPQTYASFSFCSSMYRIVTPNEKTLTFPLGMNGLAFGPKPLPLEKGNVSMSKML